MIKVFTVVSSVLASIMAATLFFVTVPKLQNDIDNIQIEAGGTSVTANPSGSATETLTKIDVDGTIYGVDSGTSVTANPSGSATETLTKIDVDGTIYGIYTPVFYYHNILMFFGDASVSFNLITKTQDVFTKSSLYNYLNGNTYNSSSRVFSASGIYQDSIIYGVYATDNNFYFINDGQPAYVSYTDVNLTLNDKVLRV